VRASDRWILAVAVSIVVAGLVGVAVHHPPAHHSDAVTTGGHPSAGPPTTARHPSPASTAPPATTAGPPGASSATLAANLLTPTDLGGFYAPNLEAADDFLDSAPCLAGTLPAPSQSGRALTGLLGPNRGSVPDITEVVLSYPGSRATAVYRSLTAAMQACSSFAMSLGGTALRVPIAAGSMAAVGDASSEYQGDFDVDGRTEQIGIAIVLSGQNVFAVTFVDTVPPSNAILGNLPSTVSAAIGKEA